MEKVLRKIKCSHVKIFYSDGGSAKTTVIQVYGRCSKKKVVEESKLPKGCKFLGWEILKKEDVAMEVSLEGFILLAKQEMAENAM